MKDNFSALAENDLLRLKSTCFLWLIFAVINFGWLSGLNFHIDNEITAIRVDPLIWLVQGRWGAYLLERYILPKTFVSFFPLAVYGLCGAYAYLLYLGSTGKRPREIEIGRAHV